MNRKKRRLSKGARIRHSGGGSCAAANGSIWAVVKSRDAGTEDVTQTTAMVSCGDLETYIGEAALLLQNARNLAGRLRAR